MPTTAADERTHLRYCVYALLIAVTAGMAAGRILSTEIMIEPSLARAPEDPEDPLRPRVWPRNVPTAGPTHGANDRARWATIRALVDNGTYAIGRRNVLPDGTYQDTGIIFENGWYTIDRVLHPQTREFFASKPPLLSTVLAAPYWLLREATGWTLAERPFSVVRTMLLVVNVIPWMLYLHYLSRMIDRLAATDWARYFAVACACFATLLSSFLITLNNHLFAACGVVFTLYPLMGVFLDDRTEWWRFALAGFFGAWTACNELPAAVFGLLLFFWLVRRWPGLTLGCFVPAALVPVAAFVLTNYLAIGEFMPAYEKFGTEWYNYEGSYWNDRRGIDRGEDPPLVYAFHLLLGHHGFFSLSPIFLLSVVGVCRSVADPTAGRWWNGIRWLAILLLPILVGFYLAQTQSYNYGGWTCGPRWFFWLIPLGILAMVPAADRLGQARWGRWLSYLLVFASLVSVSYPAWNPWRHPWLFRWWEYQGWISYP